MKIRAPKPTGEYAVGTFTYTVKDVREEVMAPGTMRSVAARVYYPVLPKSAEGMKRAESMSKNVTAGIRRAFRLPLDYEKITASGENAAECYENAPRIEGKKFPLILFNHGLCSYREGNSFLCIELASHGYVVISVAHSMEAACTEFDDGSVILYDKSITKKTYQPFLKAAAAMYRFTKMKGSEQELAGKFDEIQRKYARFLGERLDEWVKDNEAALVYAGENLQELIDFEKGIGATGLSMGGNTAYRLCTRKPEVVCGVNIDGGIFGDFTEDVLEKPFLQISCKDNENVASRVYLRHTKPVYKALFRDMRHMGFSDMKHMMKPGYTMGRLDPDEMHRNLCRCHLDFFDTYLKGLKNEPDIKSNDVITVRKYEPDM